MRVLVWSQYFWPENFRINELVDALHQNGIQIGVLTGKPNYPEGRVYTGYKAHGILHEQYAGAEVVRIPLVPRGRGSSLRLMLNYLSFILSGYLLAPLALRGRKYDLVFVYAPSPLLQALPAILLARLKHAPLVVWVQDLWPESLAATGFVKYRWVLKMVELLVRYIYRRADSILVQSEAFRRPVERLVGDPRKIHYYPNTAQMSQNNIVHTVNTELVSQIHKCFSVVFAGNLGAAQSLETILSAAEYLDARQEIQFFIIGSGSRESWLAEQVCQRRLANVVLTGRLPQTEMLTIFAAASALLVTLADSSTFALTIPSKLQAYLAAGRPVIASLNGEGAKIVRDAEAGFSCPAGDAEALAAAVLKLYGLAPNEQNRLGSNGRRYFDEHFEPSKRLRELVDHFQEVLNHNRVDGQ